MRHPTREELDRTLRARLNGAAQRWLDEAMREVARDNSSLVRSFPAVGRTIGRGPLDPGADESDPWAWRADDAGRTLLLAAAGAGAAAMLEDLYRYGDGAERRGVLRSLAVLGPDIAALGIVEDAVRSNDVGLIAAALGPYAVLRLSDHAFAHAVLKCVFVGIPLAGLASAIDTRATPELARMLAAYVHERIAAGRDVPHEVWPWIDRHPPPDQLRAIEAETEHPLADRRRAATSALEGRRRYLEAS
jgi:hypothetical protein